MKSLETDFEGEISPLDEENVKDVLCCPGGLEVKDGEFLGDISKTLLWRKDMIEKGMKGFIVYEKGVSKGFIEYMPAESAPYPIEAQGSAVIMCFHWATIGDSDESVHHKNEERLIEHLINRTKNRFSGLCVLAWDHPVHFTIDMFDKFGFEEVKKEDYILLMHLPFEGTHEEPFLLGPNIEPRDQSDENRLALDLGYSNRCPYSIHNKSKVEKAVEEMNERKIDLETYRIDTRKEAIEFSVRSWNWDWCFINGEPFDHYKMELEEIKRELRDRSRQL